VINNTISKRYAKALVQLGSENGLTDQFRKELAVLSSLVQANQGLNDILTSPTYPIERKKLIMKELAGKTACSGFVTDFLSLLIDKGRITLLVQIAQEFEQLADQVAGIIRPCIKTAFSLDDTQVASIKAALEKRTGKTVVPEVQVDSSLMAGLVVQIGDMTYDSSAKTQLKRIQDILQKG